tara:strand:- start:1817 stop:2527 length:711 start_codon:yes stop_codon:yes gene_type:complete
MNIIIRLISLIAIFIAAPVAAQSPLACVETKIRIAFFEFAPYCTQNADGQAEGILVDKLQRLMAKLGCQWQGNFYPVTQMLENIVFGESDLALVIAHPRLNARSDYSRYPIDQLQLNLYRLEDSTAVSTIEQLRKQRVIVIRGYGYGGYFNKLIDPSMAVDIHIAKDHQAALEMLRNGVGDYALGYQRPMDLALKTNPSNILSTHLSTWDLYVVVSSQYNDKRLIQQIDRYLEPAR